MLQLPDAKIDYIPTWLDKPSARKIFSALLNEIDWQEGEVFLFGNLHKIPRLQAWHGEPNAKYRYSGKTLTPQPWTATLLYLKGLLEEQGMHFNSVLLNLYRDGNDRMGWHADNEKELGAQPTIASISLGAERTFQLKHRVSKQRFDIELADGSLLIMAGVTQDHWVHQLPQRKRCSAPRINLTFRNIVA